MVVKFECAGLLWRKMQNINPSFPNVCLVTVFWKYITDPQLGACLRHVCLQIEPLIWSCLKGSEHRFVWHGYVVREMVILKEHDRNIFQNLVVPKFCINLESSRTPSGSVSTLNPAPQRVDLLMPSKTLSSLKDDSAKKLYRMLLCYFVWTFLALFLKFSVLLLFCVFWALPLACVSDPHVTIWSLWMSIM